VLKLYVPSRSPVVSPLVLYTRGEQTVAAIHRGQTGLALCKPTPKMVYTGSARYDHLFAVGSNEATARLASQGLDLILVEGFHEAPIPKIELHRPAMGGRPRYPDDPWIIAIACDADPRPTPSIPRLDLNDPRSVARFIGRWLASGGEGRG